MLCLRPVFWTGLPGPWQMFAMGSTFVWRVAFSPGGGPSPRKRCCACLAFGGCGALWGRDEHRLRTALVPFPPVGADRGRLRGGSAHGFAPRGEHSPCSCTCWQTRCKASWTGCGEVWMGPRVNGEWAMEKKQTTGRTCGRWSVCLKGRYPRKKPTEGFIRSKITRENEHQGQHAAADKQPVQPFVFGLYHGFVEG